MQPRIHGWILIIVPNLHAQPRWVDIPVAPEQERAEADLGEEVEHAVEDGFAVRRYVVAPFAQAPGDRIQDPEQDG
jgi:hypothetical protein